MSGAAAEKDAPYTSAEGGTPARDVLGDFIRYADRLHEIMGALTTPATYSETCTCGACVVVGPDAPPVNGNSGSSTSSRGTSIALIALRQTGTLTSKKPAPFRPK